MKRTIAQRNPATLPGSGSEPRRPGPRIGMMFRVLLAGAYLLAPGQATAQPQSIGRALLDLGRDYPLTPEAGLTDADARIALLFMEAAARVEPDLAEAFHWQADILAAMDRPEEALAALEQYLRLEPADEPARLAWVVGRIEALQTAEQRRDFCRQQLQVQGLPPEVVGELHYQLAVIHRNRGELPEAMQALEAARTADPGHLGALQLLREIQPDSDVLAALGEWLLARLRVNPADLDAADQLAELFEEQGLTPSAQTLRQYRDRLILEATGQKPEPPPAATQTAPAPAPSTQPAWLALAEEWKNFPPELLEWPLFPQRSVGLNVTVPAARLAPAQPLRCRVELSNRGRFTLTIGPGAMIEPRILCLVTSYGDRTRSSGPSLQVPIPRLSLRPGQSVAMEVSLEIGAIRAGMIGTPQMAHNVEVLAVVNPVPDLSPEGRPLWKPGLGGVQARTMFQRTALEVTSAQAGDLMELSQSADPQQRILAMQRLAMLLAESQHLAAGRLRYPARKVEANILRAVLMARARDADWQVRALLTECMRWFVLDGPAMQTAAQLLSDPHWLVRGLAMRMLADQTRDKVAPALQTASQRDPDPWVRAMAQALLDRLALTAPATQPTTGPGL